MKQEEKTKRIRERILEAALTEFGTKRYEVASISSICSENHLSKGLLYHNFGSKDELYLYCVRYVYDRTLEYLKSCSNMARAQNPVVQMLKDRQSFFHENPLMGNIFFEALLTPPPKLASDVQEIRMEYETFANQCFAQMLEETPLRPGVTAEDARTYFFLVQEAFSSRRSGTARGAGEGAGIEEWEEHALKMLDLILYGISSAAEKKA